MPAYDERVKGACKTHISSIIYALFMHTISKPWPPVTLRGPSADTWWGGSPSLRLVVLGRARGEHNLFLNAHLVTWGFGRIFRWHAKGGIATFWASSSTLRLLCSIVRLRLCIYLLVRPANTINLSQTQQKKRLGAFFAAYFSVGIRPGNSSRSP